MYAVATAHPPKAGWSQLQPGSPIYLNVPTGWAPSDREIVARADGRFDVSHIAFTGVRYLIATVATWAEAVEVAR